MSASRLPRNSTPWGRMMAPLPPLLSDVIEVQEKGVIAVLGRGDPILETPEFIVGRIETAGPCLGRERGIGDGEIERLETAVRVLEIGSGQRVAAPQLGSRVAVQDHVHPCQRPGGVVHLLPVDGNAARRLVGGLEEQRAGAAGGIVDRLVLAGVGADADHFRHDARHLGRGVELSLALAGLGGEVAHQVFVGVAQQVVALGTVGAKVETRRRWPPAWKAGPASRLPAAQPAVVVEVGLVDDALEVIGLGELANDRVDLVADFLVALEPHHVGKAAAVGHVDERVRPAGIFVRDVLHEQQGQNVVLVLRGIHAAAKLVTTLPERGVELGLFQGHFSFLSDGYALGKRKLGQTGVS